MRSRHEAVTLRPPKTQTRLRQEFTFVRPKANFRSATWSLRNSIELLNESFWEPDAHTRANAESWREYQQQSAPRQARTTGVDWRLMKEFTGYTRDDLIGFCLDEGLPPISGKLTPHEARSFRDVVLCNWAVVEGYFPEHWQAREALADLRRMLPWTAGDRELCDGWARVCQGKTAGPADQFYGEDVA